MKRVFSLLLSLLLVFLALPITGALAEVVYAETQLTLPDGYVATAMCQTPDGGAVMAAQDAAGGWALISWASLAAQPQVQALQHQGSQITNISIAPGGEVLVVLSPMPPVGTRNVSGGDMAVGGNAPMAAQGEGPKLAQGPGPVIAQGDGQAMVQGDGQMMVKGDGPALTQNGSPAEGTPGGEGPKLVQMGPGDLKSEMVWFDAAGSELARLVAPDHVMSICALSGRRAAVLMAPDGLSVLDEQGNALQKIGLSYIQAIAARGDELFAVEEGKLVRYDAATGKKAGTMDIVMQGSGQIGCTADGGLFMLDATGMYALDMDAGTMALITGSMGMMYGDPDNGIGSFVPLSDGFAALLTPGSGGGMGAGRVSIRIGANDETLPMGYQQRADIDPSARTEFRITALRASAKLQKAASDFQRMHPELKVTLQTQMTAGDESPTDDHIRTLNTDLLAGKGGDVLVLDGLPMDKYIQRGILKDLSQTFADVKLLAGVRTGATHSNGGMYAIPTQFSFELLWGNKQAISGLTTLAELANIALPDGQAPFAPYRYQQYLQLLFPFNQSALLNEGGKLDLTNPAFTRLLDASKALYSMQDELPDDGIAGRDDNSPAAILSMLNGATAFYPQMVASLNELMLGYTIAGVEDSACAVLPQLDGPGRGFIPSLMLGVSQMSQNSELAEEFIRLMLSPDVQQLDQGEGLPTVASALDALFVQAAERAEAKNIRAMMSFDGGNPIEMQQPNLQTLDTIRKLIDSLDQMVLVDQTLLGFIVDECGAFFDGGQDAQTTADAIAQRAWSYLNE